MIVAHFVHVRRSSVSAQSSGAITGLLEAAERGEASAQERLWLVVYDELHRVAQRQLAREGGEQLLQTTALVNEAYLRLVGDGEVHWNNRRHFFAAAAKAMRRICVDYARQRESLKRGGGAQAEPLSGVPPVLQDDPTEVLALDEALEKLRQQDPRKAEVVMLRYYAGLSVDETAQALGLAPRTVDSDWQFARVWLYRELTKGGAAPGQEACH
jgi:RNA polymerase sigma factor (TIGR02999 family)